jgi:hypothetical protein
MGGERSGVVDSEKGGSKEVPLRLRDLAVD